MTTATASPPLEHAIKRILALHQGRENAIKGKHLRYQAQLLLKTPVNDRAMRLAIVELRSNGLPIASASSPPAGYYITTSLSEIEDAMAQIVSYIIELAKHRRDLKRARARMLAGASQPHLF